jgi:hypothetical protein
METHGDGETGKVEKFLPVRTEEMSDAGAHQSVISESHERGEKWIED